MDEPRARRVADIFRAYDDASVREMATLEEGSETYVSIARQHVLNLEQALRADAERLKS